MMAGNWVFARHIFRNRFEREKFAQKPPLTISFFLAIGMYGRRLERKGEEIR